ncbi:ribonuclease E activity regulator RraA [Comamonas humi]
MTTPNFSTCDLCDAQLARVGTDFQVLPPVFLHWGLRAAFCGPVSTVQCHEDNSRVREALATPGEGRVLVVDGGASLRRALVGGNIAVSAVKNGWSGIVVNGCVRDVAELQACDIGIRALGLVPLPTEKRGAGLRDVPVQIQGQWVHPGDWLYADADGIVVSRQPLL